MDIYTHVHHDPLTDQTTISRTQDVDPIIKQVERDRQQFDGFKSETFNKVGTIPAIIVEQYMKEVGINFHEFCSDNIHIQRIMNNPDYSKFKIITGDI